MSITDELREYAGVMEHMTVNNFDPVHGASFILSLADRIDAEYRKQVTDAFTKGAIDGIDMAEHSIEYVKLPVDADGVPIHVGDRLRFNNGMIAEVRYLKIDSGGTILIGLKRVALLPRLARGATLPPSTPSA